MFYLYDINGTFFLKIYKIFFYLILRMVLYLCIILDVFEQPFGLIGSNYFIYEHGLNNIYLAKHNFQKEIDIYYSNIIYRLLTIRLHAYTRLGPSASNPRVLGRLEGRDAASSPATIKLSRSMKG